MKKNVLVFGLISGLIITGMMLYSVNQIYHKESIKSNDFIGYAALIVAFSFIYIGIRISGTSIMMEPSVLGKRSKIGLLITLVASTMYVGTWLIDYYLFKPEFIDKYITCVLDKAEADGANQVELDKKASEMANFKEMYKNPVFVVLSSYAEVFPIGLIISLISALILKRKIKDTQVVEAT